MTAKSPEAVARKRQRDRERNRTPEHLRKAREYQQGLGAEGRHANNLRSAHGLTPAGKAAMLDAQGGRCYLCGDPLAYDDAVIDHDHSCCAPTPTRKTASCAWCRRGLACANCNTIIGMALDDPGRLRRIAGSLAAVLPAVAARLAARPQQLALDIPAANAATAAKGTPS